MRREPELGARFKRIAIFALLFSLPLIAVGAIVTSLQEQMLFPTHAVPAAGPLPDGAEWIETKAASGETLKGIRIAATGEGPARVQLVGFGGNGWNAADVATMLHRIMPEADVVAFYYRGYAPSGGSPSADALIADAPLVFDAARKLSNADHVVAIGMSIGSGVATHLAKDRDVTGLVLVTPFDSLAAVAQAAFPFLPVGMLFRNEIDSAGALEGLDTPVAIIASGQDEIIPKESTERLRNVAKSLVFDRTYAQAGHNDLYGFGEFATDLRRAVNALIPAES